jgi:hypothetical protein
MMKLEGKQVIMKTIRQGLLAGLLAGLFAGFLTALLFVVDYGPANSLHGVARWLALDSQGAGKIVGFLLVLLLGGVFGVLFGVLMGRRPATLGRALGLGLLMGATWWAVVVFLLGTVINHLQFSFGSWLFPFMLLLVYGMLLGSISFQWRQQNR